MMELSKVADSMQPQEGLDSAQTAALTALRGGESFLLAARVAGVSRSTVFRWVQRDPVFRAAYNAWKLEVAESSHARLLMLGDRAVNVLQRALERGNEKVALQMVKHLGLARPAEAGSTDPKVLELQLDLKEKQALWRAETNTRKHLLRKAGYPAEERREIAEGQTTRKFRRKLAKVLASRKLEPAVASDATVAVTAPQAEPGPASEGPGQADRNSSPDQQMGEERLPGQDPAGDATDPAAQCGAPHESSSEHMT